MSEQAKPLAIVTGANRGIGLEVCRQLAQKNYRVLLTARDVEQAHKAAQSLRSAGDVHAEQLDVTSDASIAAFAARVRAEHGAIFALVNNAGISMKGFNVDVVRGTLAVNFFGALHVTQALAPLVSDGGNIVMVSSGMGELSAYSRDIKARFLDETLTVARLTALVSEFAAEVAAGQHEAHGWPSSAYRVSKASLNALTRILAKETPRLRINAVCPGWVKTDMGGPGASRTVDTGARGVVWAATLSPGGPSGGFFRDGKPIAW